MQTTYYPTDLELMQLMGQDEAPPNLSPPPGTGSNPDPYGLSSNFEGGPNGIPIAGIPQTPLPPQLQRMINGEGYSPEILAQMRASATEDVSHAALPGLSQLNRGLSMAGQYNSPAGAASRAMIGRQTGDAQSAAQRDISVNNAMVGNENKKFGLNLAHTISVENANRLFEGMGQNLGQSGANTRAATNIAFGQQPFNPGSGQPQTSAAGAAATGAAQMIGSIPFGGEDQKQNPQNSFAPPQQQDNHPKAFAQNPYRGY